MDSFLIVGGLLLTAVLFGGMVFFSGLVAPLVFTKLDATVAGTFIRQVFPWYYLMIILSSGIAAALLLALRPLDAMALAVIAATAAYARQGLMPRINRARDRGAAGDSAEEGRFARLHRYSVWLNGVQLLAAAVVLARFAVPGAG